jgi:hypothetical protein
MSDTILYNVSSLTHIICGESRYLSFQKKKKSDFSQNLV